MDVRYTYRLRPGLTAQRYLAREWGMCRYVWNQLVAESQDRHLDNQIGHANGVATQDLPTFGYADQDKFLTRLRATTTDENGHHWLAEGSSVAHQQTVRDFARSRTKALQGRKNKAPVTRRAGLPKFKSRHTSLPTMNYTRRGFSLKPHPGSGRLALALPGGVLIPIVWSRDLPSEPRSARVFQDSLGHWYVSFVTTLTTIPAPAETHVAVGIDWGVTEIATTTVVDLATGAVDDGTTYDLPHPQHAKNAAAKLARYQRMMARRRRPKGQPPSKGYQEAKRWAAKSHKKVARQRADDGNKWARKVATDRHQIAVEDFKPKFLAKTTMARKAADGRIGATKEALIWQAAKHGRDLRLVHPAHTTTDCSSCDARTKHRLPLGERTYTCESCGHARPRDKNSATVVVARSGFRPADAEGTKPEPAVARPRQPESGIPRL